MPVRRRLLLLAFSLLVPAVIACGIAVLFTYSHERQRSEENLLRTAQALAESVDRELDSIVLRLQALATSPSLQSGDMQAFWQQASQAVREDGMWVVLITQGGQQVLNTLKPFGEPLPHHTVESSIGHVVEHIFSRKSPSVSDVFTGPVTGKPTLGIAVPVTGRNGEILYSLFMGILPSALKNVVSSASLPKEWLAAAFDTQPVIVARSRDPEPYIGTAPVPALVQAMASSATGIINANSREGQPTRVAYSRSPKYGWYFAVGVPKAELAAAVFQTILLFLAIALALLTIGAVLALGFGRSL
ncbi:MAG: cache domain-containing protein, partial [Rhodospirillales bacterium]|nr:cache domain-containing protein [Rhodospirillales bacterium]